MPVSKRDITIESIDRIDTLAVDIVEWSDAVLMRRAWERASIGSSVWTVLDAEHNDRTPDAPVTSVDSATNLRRVWWRNPDCLRDEVYSGSVLLGVNICHGSDCLSYAAGLGLLFTNNLSALGRRPPPWIRVPNVGLPTIESELEQIRLLCPPFRHTDWGITVVGREQNFAGREAFSVEARRLSPGASSFYWDGFDLFTAIIDSEHGLPLRMAAIVDGVEAASYAVRSVRFNETIPDEVFHFEPPKGTLTVKVRSERDS